MNDTFSFCINFSGITLRFTLPEKIIIPDYFTDLLCEDTDAPTAEYRIELLSSPLCPEGCAVFERNDFSIYPFEEGMLRIYTPLTAPDGCQVACLMRKSGKNVLYYPACRWEKYKTDWHCTHLLCGELLLRFQDALLLHSSVVSINGKAVLFCGESGAGKSTQASLWKEHLGAEVLNGDRCVIKEDAGAFYGGGSPWCGTSEIYSPKSFPIAGIILMKKSQANTIQPLGAKAFPRIFSQLTLNTWDKDFVDFASSKLVHLLNSVPVFELNCRPDKEAAHLAYNTLFTKE
ncbi:MAG: hypothetical protein IJA62_05320 [Ruminococcus sp.]|nr:hypothetical protein [Ruminococcus sp.]